MRNGRLRIVAALILAMVLLVCVFSAQASASGTVPKVTIKTLTMNKRTLSIDLGRSFDLSVSVKPSKAKGVETIEWESSQPEVVRVEPNPTNPRKAKITVIAPDYPANQKVNIIARAGNGRKAVCFLTVRKVAVTKVAVVPSKKTVLLTSPRPAPFALKASIAPVVAGEQGVTWSSQKPAVATVDPETGAVTALAEGTTRIIATAKDGSNKKGYSTVTVKAVRVKSLRLEADSEYMDIGDERQITGNILPVNATWQKITWDSSDKTVASIDEAGKVKAKKSGVTTISATVDVGKYAKKASIQVYVRSSNPTKVAITALGDVIIGGDPRTYRGATPARSSLPRYNAYLAQNNGDYSFPFQYIKNILDVTQGGVRNLRFMNLEGAITSKGNGNYRTNRTYVFKGEPEHIKGVAGLMDAISVANNHANDFGGLNNTVTNINRYGDGARAVKEGKPEFYTVGDKKVVFIACVSKTNSASAMAKKIRNVKNQGADLVVVSVHWTNMTQNKRGVSGYMQSWSRSAIRAGADLVLGHHRHIVSGIEKYRGKYIVYDLGNTIAGGASDKHIYAFQVFLEMHEDFNETSAVKIYPLWSTSATVLEKNSDWQPVPVRRGEENGVARWNRIIEIINTNSPKGEDGKKFDATGFMTAYPERE